MVAMGLETAVLETEDYCAHCAACNGEILAAKGWIFGSRDLRARHE